MTRREQPDTLFITNRTIKFGSLTYQIKNLTFVEKRRLKRKFWVSLGALLGALILAASAGYALKQYPEDILRFLPEPEDLLAEENWVALGTSAAASVIVVSTALLGLLERLFRRRRFELTLETSSGSTGLLASRQEWFIDELVEIITAIMDDDAPALNYSVNVRKKIIKKSKSETIMGDKFENIKDATIINRSNVQDAIKTISASSGDQVSKALEAIAVVVEESGNAAAGSVFNALIEELRKPVPDKLKLRQCWDGLTNLLPSVAKLADACAKVATLLG